LAGATISPALPQIEAVFHATLMVKLRFSVHAPFIAVSAPLIGVTDSLRKLQAKFNKK